MLFYWNECYSHRPKELFVAGNHETAERNAMLYRLFGTSKLHNVKPIE